MLWLRTNAKKAISYETLQYHHMNLKIIATCAIFYPLVKTVSDFDFWLQNFWQLRLVLNHEVCKNLSTDIVPSKHVRKYSSNTCTSTLCIDKSGRTGFSPWINQCFISISHFWVVCSHSKRRLLSQLGLQSIHLAKGISFHKVNNCNRGQAWVCLVKVLTL